MYKLRFKYFYENLLLMYTLVTCSPMHCTTGTPTTSASAAFVERNRYVLA